MDIYCPKRGCAEPFENDSLHDAVDDGLFSTYHDALHAFQREGCTAVGFTHSTGNDNGKSEVMAAMFDLMGDDVDGAMSAMEDFEYMGLI